MSGPAPIGGAGSVPGFDPGSSGVTAFRQGLQDKSVDDLVGMLGQPGLQPWQMKEIGNALLEKLNKAEGASGLDKEEEDKLKKLLEKLRNGTITDAELKELQGLMQAAGMPPEAIANAFAAFGKKPPENDNDI